MEPDPRKATPRGVAKPRGVIDFATAFDADRWPVDAVARIGAAARVWLDIRPPGRVAHYLRRAIQLSDLAARATAKGDAAGAAWAASGAAQAAWQAQIADGRDMVDAGVKAFRAAEGANLTRAAQALARQEEWQRRADEIWLRMPDHTAANVARLLDAKRWNTIRRYIKKK